MFKKPFILYDPDCPLCLRFKQGLERIIPSEVLHFYSVQTEKIYSEFPFLKINECSKRVHLVDEENNVYQGGEVIRYLLKLNPQTGKLAWLLDSKAGIQASESFYQAIDKFREKIKSWDKDCDKCDH